MLNRQSCVTIPYHSCVLSVIKQVCIPQDAGGLPSGGGGGVRIEGSSSCPMALWEGQPPFAGGNFSYDRQR